MTALRVATEPMGLLPSCFQLAMIPEDLHAFNHECRAAFVSYSRRKTMSWAISCSELYNLFAGEQSLVEAMLGIPVEVARKRFLAFAEPLSRQEIRSIPC